MVSHLMQVVSERYQAERRQPLSLQDVDVYPLIRALLSAKKGELLSLQAVNDYLLTGVLHLPEIQSLSLQVANFYHLNGAPLLAERQPLSLLAVNAYLLNELLHLAER